MERLTIFLKFIHHKLPQIKYPGIGQGVPKINAYMKALPSIVEKSQMGNYCCIYSKIKVYLP